MRFIETLGQILHAHPFAMFGIGGVLASVSGYLIGQGLKVANACYHSRQK